MDKNDHLKLLKLMLESRAADKREAILFRQSKGHFQLSSSGHEALMSMLMNLEETDYLYPHYRDAKLMLAKGLNIIDLAREFFANSNSTSQGRSMPIHISSRKYNIFPTAATTTTQCLPAVGNAWGQKISKSDSITVCSIGDGSTRGGEFYEAVCYAIQEQLPIIFVVEDNHYAISTSTKFLTPYNLQIFNSDLITHINGSCVESVNAAANKSIDKARNGYGPSILWCDLERIDPHTCSDDQSQYRSKIELEHLRDPIEIYKNKLIEYSFINNEEFNDMSQSIEERVKNIYKDIILEPAPNLAQIYMHLYGPEVKYNSKPLVINGDIDMVNSINKTLDFGLENNNKLIIFGEDIADPKGGVFGFTKGLSTKYPKRVINSPLAEATIVGTAVGLAASGYKPVFEIQFIDFITPAFNQLVTHVPNLRWRSCGSWSCPLVIYAPYGAYLPSGGNWHSQSNEGWWTHMPGLRVAVPSTPEDAAGLFLAAFEDLDPSLILIPKHIFRIESKMTSQKPIRFGQAKIIQRGTDITIVGWGNMISMIKNVSKILKDQDITIEIIDLRTLVPYDSQMIIDSLKKTGRLIVVQEDTETSSFGATIITNIVTNFYTLLKTSPKLITRKDIHIPYHHQLESAVFPSEKDILEAINQIMK